MYLKANSTQIEVIERINTDYLEAQLLTFA